LGFPDRNAKCLNVWDRRVMHRGLPKTEVVPHNPPNFIVEVLLSMPTYTIERKSVPTLILARSNLADRIKRSKLV
jgi:hypothetical protein